MLALIIDYSLACIAAVVALVVAGTTSHIAGAIDAARARLTRLCAVDVGILLPGAINTLTSVSRRRSGLTRGANVVSSWPLARGALNYTSRLVRT